MSTIEIRNPGQDVALATRIPREHELLPAKSLTSLDSWMDEQLTRLEQRFASFVTAKSTKNAIGR